VLAKLADRGLFSLNCHRHTESSDFLGGLRPNRAAATGGAPDAGSQPPRPGPGLRFAWADGPLVTAMRRGAVFLADELSLADDSVIERLNSVLEPERTILLAEKIDTQSTELVTAADGFRFVGTMNPGGDYGKKELSPALKNRFTEIWCPAVESAEQICSIARQNLAALEREGDKAAVSQEIVQFIEWMRYVPVPAIVYPKHYPCLSAVV
jgi:midasin